MNGSPALRAALAAACLLLPAAAASAADAGPASALDEVERLRRACEELGLRCDDLQRRIEETHASTRSAVEDYLDDRGLTGPAWTDRDLAPLGRVLRRATVGARLRLRYEASENLLDLESSRDDQVDFAETLARLQFGFVLAGGTEIEVEFQGLTRAGAVFRASPLAAAYWPAAGLEGLDPSSVFEPGQEASVRRAELRLPGFNLLGRLCHWPATLIIGRQELAFGRGFLLGADEEGTGTTWDAVRLSAESGRDGAVDLFCGRAAGGAHAVASRMAGQVAPDADPEIELAGARIEARGLLEDSSLAAYYVFADAAPAAAAGGYAAAPSVEVSTLGAEASVSLAPRAALRAEAAGQWGEYDGRDVRDSFALEAEVEWRVDLRRAHAPLRASVCVAHASADFVPLAQGARGRFDAVGLLTSRNVRLWGARAVLGADERWKVAAAFASAYAVDEDAPAGAFLADGTSGSGGRLGEALSISVSWPLFGDPGSRLSLGYCRFEPGDYFAPSADGADVVSIQLSAGF